MTKRSHKESTNSLTESSDWQLLYDAEGNGSHEDGDESGALKKPRSFMATLVRIPFSCEIHAGD